MSIADKQMFLNKISEILSDKLTASDLSSTLSEISELLINYNIEYSASNSTDNTNDINNTSMDLINYFITAKEIEGRTKKTIKHYRYYLSKALKQINVPVESINVHHIRKYFITNKNNGLSNSTIEGYRFILNSFFDWLLKEQLIKTNPMLNIGSIKSEKKIRIPYSDIDIEKLKEHCGDIRNRAIIFFLLSTGCRVSEMCELNRNDIDFDHNECVVHGKGDKQRTVFLTDVASMMLKRYFEERKDNYPALFVGKGSDRMTPGGIRFMLNTIAKKCGVENCHPHRFRRTLATNLIKRGMSIQDVALILGHDKIETTMKYVYISQNDVKNIYQKCI